MAITARIINVDTAEILGVADGKGQSSRSSTILLGGGGNWSGFGGGNVDFGSSNFQQTIIGEATKQAVDQLSANLVADAPKVSVRTAQWRAWLPPSKATRSSSTWARKAGIKVGDQFNVERVTKEIKDPNYRSGAAPPVHHRRSGQSHRCGRRLRHLRTGFRDGLQDRRQGQDSQH